MKRDEYRDRFRGLGYPDEQISACERGVEFLEACLADLPEPVALDTAAAEHVPGFGSSMIDQGLNERGGFLGIHIYEDQRIGDGFANYELAEHL